MTCTLQWKKKFSKLSTYHLATWNFFPQSYEWKCSETKLLLSNWQMRSVLTFSIRQGQSQLLFWDISVTKHTRNIMTEAMVRSKEDCITTKVSDIHVRPLKAQCYSILNWTNECELAWRLLYSKTWTWTNIQLCILHTILLDWN